VASAGAAGGWLKWVGATVVLLAVVVLLVWGGTRRFTTSSASSTGSQAEARAAAAGVTYLATHKDKPGVHTTPSGLQYEILTAGIGPRPSAADSVTVHYIGTLLDGTVFDSSVARGQPATFPLGQVIPGWTEGVQLMPTGAKYRFTIPPQLGYGASGAGGVIPPNAVLVFDIELLAIQGR